MLRAARERLATLDNVRLEHGELEELPIEDATLDAATMCLVLHHLSDPPAALREAQRVLKPAGRLLIVDMFEHDRAEYRQQMGHVWLGFTRDQIEQWLAGAGHGRLRKQPAPARSQAHGAGLVGARARR